MRKFLLKRLWCIPFGIIAYAVTLYAQNNTDWTEEVYSQSIYPILASVVGFLPSLVGFSMSEWLMVLFILFCLVYLVYYIRKFITTKPSPKENRGMVIPRGASVSNGAHSSNATTTTHGSSGTTAAHGNHDAATTYAKTNANANKSAAMAQGWSSARSTHAAAKITSRDNRVMIVYRCLMGMVAIFCLVYFAFTALCGLNYYRHTFSAHTDYVIEQSSTEELERLCISLSDDLDSLRAQLGEDRDLFESNSEDFNYYREQSLLATKTLAERYPILSRQLYSSPKPVLMSPIMTKAGIAGVFFPFTMESNINTEAPLSTIPSTMAHELAHQSGFMREDEANFIAYLACRDSDDALMQYSGTLLAFNHSIAALEAADSNRALNVASKLSQAVQEDIKQNEQFWTENEGVISDASTSINDNYLKANRQTDGVSSYGRMVDLLLAEQRAA